MEMMANHCVGPAELVTRNNLSNKSLSEMTDRVEDILAPAVVERAMSIYESFGERRHADIVQARKALTRHVYGLICGGEISDHRLTISGLAYLKQLERERKAAGRRPARR